MTDVIQYLNQMCVRTGPPSIHDIDVKSGLYTLEIPVFNGELNCEQTATLRRMEFTYDGDCIDLYGKLPRELLQDEDMAMLYGELWEAIEDALCG